MNCNMHMFLVLIFTAVVLTAASLVHATTLVDPRAVEHDVYIGAGVGYTHFHGINKIEGVNFGTEDAAAASAFVGYNFNEYFGTELGYSYAGRGNTDGNRFENKGGTISIIGLVPAYGELSLFGEVGGFWAQTDGLDTQDHRVSSLLGAGLNYRLADALDIQSRWRYLRNVAELDAPRSDNKVKPNQNTTTLELVYHPFRGVRTVPVNPPPPAIDYPIFEEPVAQDRTFELASDVLFGFGTAALKTDGRIALDRLHQKLVSENQQDDTAMVVGYTDRIGSAAVNQRLSERRARAVADYLIFKGLLASKVAVEGRGSSDSLTGSLCDGITSKEELIQCLTPDRRVEVRLVSVSTGTH